MFTFVVLKISYKNIVDYEQFSRINADDYFAYLCSERASTIKEMDVG